MKKMFTVKDLKAEAFNSPFINQTKAEAIRGFITAAADPNCLINQHPNDFALYEVAEWDELNGTITLHKDKILLGSALDFQKPQEA